MNELPANASPRPATSYTRIDETGAPYLSGSRCDVCATVYRSYPGIRVPFISAIVDLEEGGTIKGNLLEVEPHPGNLTYGMPVRVVFRGAESALGAEASGYVAHFFVPDGDRQ
jgi:uncharacterized protein